VLLIPALGITGAAVATFLAYSVQHALLFVAAGCGGDAGIGPWPQIQLAVATGLAFIVLLLPTDAGGLVLRMVVGLACLAWFVRVLLTLTAPAEKATAPSVPGGAS
jgi:hypothetical protein